MVLRLWKIVELFCLLVRSIFPRTSLRDLPRHRTMRKHSHPICRKQKVFHSSSRNPGFEYYFVILYNTLDGPLLLFLSVSMHQTYVSGLEVVWFLVSLLPDYVYPSGGFSFNMENLVKPVHVSDNSRSPSTFQQSSMLILQHYFEGCICCAGAAYSLTLGSTWRR